MKYLLLFWLLAVCCAPQGFAQKILFTDTSNKWSLVAFTSDPSVGPASARYAKDTVIAGKIYHRLTTNASIARDTLAVREDTLSGKIYFRFLTPKYAFLQTADTAEHILFDYNLVVGDTLKVTFGTNAFNHVIERLDSVRLGSSFYKHWKVLVSKAGGGGYLYEFIEGVGTNQTPANILYPFGLLPEGYHLRCFRNKGVAPPCIPAVYIPYSYYAPTWPLWLMPVDSFDNNVSCLFKYVGVSSIERNPAPVLSPNPGGKEIMLNLPPSISKCAIIVTDLTGRLIAAMDFPKATKIPIGQYVQTPGVYYYTLQDANTGQRYTGRFIYR